MAKIYGYASVGRTFKLGRLAQSYAGSGASESQVEAYVAGWCHFADIPMTIDSEFHLDSDEEMLALARAMYKHEAAGELKTNNDQILCGIQHERENSRPSADPVLSTTCHAAVFGSPDVNTSPPLCTWRQISIGWVRHRMWRPRNC
jgi:hypothetical protein